MTTMDENFFTRLGRAARTADAPVAAGGGRPLVLVATDFSPVAEVATRTGAELAARLHGRLQIVHVVSVGGSSPKRSISQPASPSGSG